MTTTRIRWADTHRGIPRIEGAVGSLDAYLFAIYPPGDGPGRDAQWLLCCRLPGSDALSAHADDPDELKAEAERWLEEFVSALGAVFPGGHSDGNAIEAYCATGTGDDRHLEQYAVRLPDGTTAAYGDQSWVKAGLGARDHDGASTVVRDIWVSYGPWRIHETTVPERS